MRGYLPLMASPQSAVQALVANLGRFGGDAHLYLPGWASPSGLFAGNYSDAGNVLALNDGLVAKASDFNGLHATQATSANQPTLRRGLTNYWRSSNITGNVTTGGTINITSGLPDPYGGNTAIKQAATTSNGYHLLYQTNASRIGTFTICATLKNSGQNYGYLGINGGGTCVFDLTTGLVASSSGNFVSASAQNIGNGWWILAAVMTSTVATANVEIGGCPGTGWGTYTGDGTSGITMYRLATYAGAVTAAQIAAEGGVSLTATVPVSSWQGPWRWDMDSSHYLSMTLPANFTAATVIDVGLTGQTVSNGQNIAGFYSINSSTYGRLILPSAPTAYELAAIQAGFKALTGFS